MILLSLCEIIFRYQEPTVKITPMISHFDRATFIATQYNTITAVNSNETSIVIDEVDCEDRYRLLLLTPMDRYGKEGQAHRELYVHNLEGVDGCHGEGRWLLVLMVKLVEVLVQPRSVVHPVHDVGCVVLLMELR